MKEYNSIYFGIVVQNNDPEKRGRVKVFVPHITSTVYKKWVEDKTNKRFNFPGDNIGSDLTPIINDLKPILPWADISAPLTSENASGRFNNYNLIGNISDSNFYTNFQNSSATAPGEVYEKNIFRLNDAFTGKNKTTNNPNPYSYMYKPSTYSNKAKGSFGIPNVGSHVYVFFRDGDPHFPVLIGASYGKSDWSGIYDDALDYPGKFENFSQSITEDDVNVNNYRNKYVLNQKGGVFEIVNSDLNEKIKLTHYSGSFKEFNNQTNIELAIKNDQKLVLNDQYNTVQGNKNDYTGKTLDTIITRDNYRKVGNLNDEYFQQWKEIAGVIQDNKQLFEIKRALNNDVKDSNGNTIIKRNSVKQTRSGTFDNYPVTDGTFQYTTLDGTSNTTPNSIGSGYVDHNNVVMPDEFDTAATSKNVSQTNWLSLSGNEWGPGGTGKSLSTQDGTWDEENNKEKLKDIIDVNLKKLTDIELELGLGGSEIIEVSKHKLETIGVLMNDFGSIRMDDIGKLTNSEIVINEDTVYMNRKGTPLLEYVHVQDLPGGNYTLNVSNRYNVMVGAGGLNLKSYGPVNMSGTITNIAGEQVNVGSNNEINIDSNVINISAEILRLRNKNQRQVLVDSSLGVNKNVVIGGGLHVEGETFLQHVTAPREFQETELSYARLRTGAAFCATLSLPSSTDTGTQGCGIREGDVTLTIKSSTDCVVDHHSHAFANLPLTLTNTNKCVRTAAATADLNGNNRIVATRRCNSKK